MLGLKTTRCRSGEERGGFAEGGIGGALIGVGIEDLSRERLEGIVVANEFVSEPAEEFGMRGWGFFPVAGEFDKAASHQLLPKAVGHNLRESFVLWRGDEGGEEVAGVGGVFGETIAYVGIEKFFEGPCGRDFRTGR